MDCMPCIHLWEWIRDPDGLVEDQPNNVRFDVDSENVQIDLHSDMAQKVLDVETLLNITPITGESTDTVQNACRDALIQIVKNQKPVHETFFSLSSPHSVESRLNAEYFELDYLATIFTCQALAYGNDEFKFHTMIDAKKVEEKLRDIYEGLHWKKLGESLLYPVVFIRYFSELPKLNLELATKNYLGGPLDWTKIHEDVQAAIHKMTIPANISRLTLGEVEVYHGVEVIEFIMDEPRELGLWTTEAPDNKRVQRPKDRCHIM
ncbi:uncharacterized protein LOC106175071 [Lingula anatina]|uniref:Uncharacterized protein LOC106175071 n=1 Tax=Lingula anatina TaxID=7574 RepID=A0A1S3JPR3_LINAN|nr:uncharacterized protein LOC106175071 [Lingula anatina]|eukprot:XP_013412347.1 uncharacterized protein LOC106175071 [Lingula anatina]